MRTSSVEFLRNFLQVDIPHGLAYSQRDLFSFNSASFIGICVFLACRQSSDLRVQKNPSGNLGFSEGLVCPLLPFRPAALPIRSLRNIFLLFFCILCLHSHTLFLSCLIRPYSPHFSHTTLQTVNPQCWLRDTRVGMFKRYFKTSSRKNSHG